MTQALNTGAGTGTGAGTKRPAVQPANKSKVKVEIFRTGAHVAADGATLSVNRADLAEAARNYDPALHEAPIVFGHPVDDAAPAHGWVAGLAAEDDRLVAELTDVSDALKGLVRQGAYRKVSAAFYRPDAPANPTPGALHLHHVGVLGAVPPAVKGLQPIQFADEAAHLLTFAGIDLAEEERRAKSFTARLWGLVQGMLQKPGVMDQLEDIIVAEGADLARAALSNLSDALADQPENKTGSNEAEPAEEPLEAAAPAEEAPTEEVSDQVAEEEEADVAISGELGGALGDLSGGLTGRLSFTEYEARLRSRIANEQLVDQLIADGRFVSGRRDDTLAFMESLGARGDTIAFAEGREESPLTYFRDLLKDLPPLVAFAEVAAAPQEPAAGNTAMALPKGTQVDPEGLTLHAKAEAIRRSNPSTSYLAAVAEAAKAG